MTIYAYDALRSFLRFVDAFHLEHAAADMQIALGNAISIPASRQILVDRRNSNRCGNGAAGAHFAAPNTRSLKIDGAFAEFFQKTRRRRIL